MIEFALGVLFSPIFWGFLFAAIWWMERAEVVALFPFIFFAGLVYLIYHQYSPLLPEHFWRTLAISYVPVGLLWSFVRWGSFTRKLVEESNREIARYKKDKEFELGKCAKGSSRKSPEEVELDFQSALIRERKDLKTKLVINHGDNLDRVVGWIINWPISIINHAFNDVIEAIERIVKVYMKGIYTRISESALKGLDQSAQIVEKE